MEFAAAIVLGVCLLGMVHTYVLYPLSLRLFRRRYAAPPEFADGAWPTVAVLIPAYNEEKVIGAKLANSLALEYESGKLEIFVGSDGSTDRTNDIVRACSDPRVRLIDYGGRNGKPEILNRLVRETQAEIIVMTDANVQVETSTFRRLIRHFADDSVAGVVAQKQITRGSSAEMAAAEHVYHRLAGTLKLREAERGGFSGAHGAYYAMRRSWFRPYPLVAMNDDILSLTPALLAGRRVAFEPSAFAYEEAAGIGTEFRRRIRVGASSFMTLSLCRQLVSPRRGILAYTFFSHKVLRWYFPFLMVFGLIANLFLLDAAWGKALLLIQLVGYAMGLLGGLGALIGVHLPILYPVFAFLTMNAAFLCGWFAYRTGTRSAVWEPTER